MDGLQTLENVIKFCYEDFKQSETKIVFRKHNNDNQFIFLH